MKEIYYNQLIEKVSFDEINWVKSSRISNFGAPIFDFDENTWCNISATRNGDSLCCFMKLISKSNEGEYYRGFSDIKGKGEIITFICYRVEKNHEGKWVKSEET